MDLFFLNPTSTLLSTLQQWRVVISVSHFQQYRADCTGPCPLFTTLLDLFFQVEWLLLKSVFEQIKSNQMNLLEVESHSKEGFNIRTFFLHPESRFTDTWLLQRSVLFQSNASYRIGVTVSICNPFVFTNCPGAGSPGDRFKFTRSSQYKRYIQC